MTLVFTEGDNLPWLRENDFTKCVDDKNRWNGPYFAAEKGSAFGAPAEFHDLHYAADGTWIAALYEHTLDQVSWSNAGLGFSRAKDAFMDAVLRDWGRLSDGLNMNTGVFENPQPDDPLFCQLYEMGFQYTGEGDWAINLGEYATGYLHYSGPGAGCESWVTDTPEWQGQINGGTPGPRHGDLLAAAVWVKLQAGTA